MTERNPLRPIERRHSADINLLYRTLADSIRNATADRAGDMPMTSFDHSTIMQEVGAGLDVIWGDRPGDPDAAMRSIVERDTALARLQPLDTAVNALRRAMPADLRELVESEAQS